MSFTCLGPHVVRSSSEGKKWVDTFSPLYLPPSCCFWSFQAQSREGGSGAGDEEEGESSHDRTAVAGLLRSGPADALQRQLLLCFHGFSGDAHWEHCSESQFSFFQLWRFSLGSYFPKLSLLASRDPLGKNLNYLPANSLPQIHHNTHMPLAPAASRSVQPDLLYSAASVLGWKPSTQPPVCYFPASRDDTNELLTPPRAAPPEGRGSISPLGMRVFTAQLSLMESSQIPLLSHDLSLLCL